MGNNIVQGCSGCESNTNHFQIIGEESQFNNIRDHRFQKSWSSLIKYCPKDLSPLKPQFQQYILILREDNDKFVDIYFSLNPLTVGQSQVEQKRISQMESINNIYDNISGQQIKDRCSNYNRELRKALQILKDIPSLIRCIIPSNYVIRQGMFVVYLPLNGDNKIKVQVVIDDMVPIHYSTNTYLFSQSKNEYVWMMVIEKAFAKILGSYKKLQKLKWWEFLEEMSGIPNTTLENPKSWYRESYCLDSYSFDMVGQNSVYYKFTIEQATDIQISIWQQRQSYFDDSVQYFRIVTELAYKDPTDGYHRKILVDTNNGNKTMLTESFMELGAGQYFLHVYPWFSKQTIKRVNIVVYSSKKVIFRLREENFMRKFKDEMVDNLFKSELRKKRLSLVREQSSLSARFLWDGFRGILCIKNLYNHSQQFKIQILSSKLSNVYFQGKPNESAIVVNLDSQKHGLVIFIRRDNNDLGQFYKTTSL